MLETAITEAPQETPQDNLIWIEALPARVYHTPQYGEVPIPVDKLSRFADNFKKNVRGQEIATDFDHGMDRAKGNAASGWYRDFEVKPSSDDPNQFSLYAAIELTEDAKREIADKKWKYFSLEWEDEWVDNSGSVYKDVVTGGGFTNRPVAKRMMPINFSEHLWQELDDETKKEFAVWSTAFVNTLPDSAFLYIQSGGNKDGEGKTVPRTLRHFPYKDDKGKIDLPHLRNAIARIPQSGSWLTDSLKNSLQSRARSLLAAASKMAEFAQDVEPDKDDVAISRAIDAVGAAIQVAEPEDKSRLQRVIAMLKSIQTGDASSTMGMSELLEVIDESKEWEHSEPGTGPTPQIGSPEQPDPGVGQPVPRIQGDPSREDPSIGGGWRREPLPKEPGEPGAPDPNSSSTRKVNMKWSEFVDKACDTLEPAEAALLKRMFSETDVEEKIPADDTAIESVLTKLATAFSEAKNLRENLSISDEEKKFAEQFPHIYKEQLQMREDARVAKANAFSESVKTVKRQEGDKQVPTTQGLSAIALEKVTETHRKFAEGTASVDDFEETISTIINGGLVQYAENGSSREGELPDFNTSTAEGVTKARQLFADKVTERQRKYAEENAGKTLSFSEAMQQVAKEMPELAQAYRVTLPA